VGLRLEILISVCLLLFNGTYKKYFNTFFRDEIILLLARPQIVIVNSGSVAELANVSVIHPTYSGSNLGTDRKYFLILFTSHLNPNLSGVSY
jgi:hypothetical protein